MQTLVHKWNILNTLSILNIDVPLRLLIKNDQDITMNDQDITMLN